MGISKVHHTLGLTCLLTFSAVPCVAQSAGGSVSAAVGTAATVGAPIPGYFVPVTHVEALQLLGIRGTDGKPNVANSSSSATPQTTAEALAEAVSSIEKYTAILAKLRIQSANNVLTVFGSSTDNAVRNRALDQVDRLVKLEFGEFPTVNPTRTTFNYVPATTGANAVPAHLSVHYNVQVSTAAPNPPANGSPSTVAAPNSTPSPAPSPQPSPAPANPIASRVIPATIRLQMDAGYVIRRQNLGNTWRTLTEGL